MARTLTKKPGGVVVPERLRLQTRKPSTEELQTAVDAALREMSVAVKKLHAAVVELQDTVEGL